MICCCPIRGYQTLALLSVGDSRRHRAVAALRLLLARSIPRFPSLRSVQPWSPIIQRAIAFQLVAIDGLIQSYGVKTRTQ